MKNSKLVFASLFLSVSSALAQEAVPGEYLIRPVQRGIHTSSESAPQLYKSPSVGNFSTQSVDTTCSDLIANGTAESCEPNFIYRTQEISNDAMASELWGMRAIQADKAWPVTQGSSDVVVAVIDTGIDYNHPDLAANVWTNPGEIAGNGIDDDGDGIIDDVHGINAVSGAAQRGNPMDDNFHGTHVSGTIAGVGNNGIGVIGVAPNVKVMALKFITSKGSGTLFDAITAIEYMVTMKKRGVNIVASNNSWGGSGYSRELEIAIEHARDAGILFLAAAGNEANNNDANKTYPASYTTENVISIAALNQDGTLAGFSNYGAQTVQIAAPGVAIRSTVPGGGYEDLSGTSMATPHVTGVAALIASVLPGAPFSVIKDRLFYSANRSSLLNGQVVGGRVLNAFNSVTGAAGIQTSGPVSDPAPGAKIRSLSTGGSVSAFTLRVSASGSTSARLTLKIDGRSCTETGSLTVDQSTVISGKTNSKTRTVSFNIKNDISSKSKTLSRIGIRRSSIQSKSAVRTTCVKTFRSLRVR